MLPAKLGALGLAVGVLCASHARADDAGAASQLAQASPPNPAAAPPAPPKAAPETAPPATTPGVQQLQSITVTSQKLDQSRDQLDPDIGATSYRFTERDLELLPLGVDTPLNQVILQAPGVVQDSYGQLHVRGDHANLQYRINDVIIPEPITGFGQGLDTRFARQINLLTGALPAQYGYRTAGVIDILSRTAGDSNGGSVTAIGGSDGFYQTGAQAVGTSGSFNAFVEGDYLHGNNGIENPTASRDPLHDTTTQSKSFGYVSDVIDPNNRVSFMFGTSLSHFEIPDTAGLAPVYALAGAPLVPSADLNARQDESNSFQVLTWQSTPSDALGFQVSVFHRHTDVHYMPDPIGDLEYEGDASTIFRKLDSTGLQGDVSYQLGDSHVLRAGVFFEAERFASTNTAEVFPANALGMQTSTVPLSIEDDSALAGDTYGVYVQDEWHATDALTVNYGVRADRTTTVTDEGQWSPRLGVVYQLDDATRLHAGYARYFTPPPTEIIGLTSISKFQDTTNALPTDVNTAVLSERSNYFDLGLSHQLTRDWTVGLDAYYRRVENLQDEGQFGNALIYSAFNYRQGRIGGLEATASYKHDDWSAYINLAASRAEGRDIITGQYNFAPAELAYISDHWIHLDHDQTLTASAGTAYRWGATTLSTDLLFGSGLRRGFVNSDHEPAYTQVNVSAVQSLNEPWIGHAEVRLTVVNLFDRVYELRDGTGVGISAPQYGPRRGLFGALTKYF